VVVVIAGADEKLRILVENLIADSPPLSLGVLLKEFNIFI
jgi:hypothetical protein